MIELLAVAVAGALLFRTFFQKEDDIEVLPVKFSEKLGKLWDIVHQGMRENRLLRAEKALLTILKIDEKNAAAYNRLGILYAKQKVYRDAIDCFEIACSIEPTASSLHNLGLIFYETENYQKSVIAFDEALKLDDQMAARHIALAKAFEKLGNNKRMVQQLEKAVELEPTHESYMLLSEAYNITNQSQKAAEIDKKFQKILIPAGKTRTRVKRAKRVVV